jgi:hypothetical protein
MKILKIAKQELPFAVPPKLAKNFRIIGDLSNVENWQAKIILGNSMAENMRVGNWDKIGYVMISLSSNQIIPIARSDEHSTGYELLQHYIDKGLVKGNDWTSIWSMGHNYIYKANDENKVEALRRYRSYGGINSLVEWPYAKKKAVQFIDEYLNDKGVEPNVTGISKTGQYVINTLENIAKKTLANDESVFKLTYDFVKWINQNSFVMTKALEGSFDEKKWLELTLSAEATRDFKEIQSLVLGATGIKNRFHNALKHANIKDYDYKELLAFWGNVELALLEFRRLGEI